MSGTLYIDISSLNFCDHMYLQTHATFRCQLHSGHAISIVLKKRWKVDVSYLLNEKIFFKRDKEKKTKNIQNVPHISAYCDFTTCHNCSDMVYDELSKHKKTHSNGNEDIKYLTSKRRPAIWCDLGQLENTL